MPKEPLVHSHGRERAEVGVWDENEVPDGICPNTSAGSLLEKGSLRLTFSSGAKAVNRPRRVGKVWAWDLQQVLDLLGCSSGLGTAESETSL